MEAVRLAVLIVYHTQLLLSETIASFTLSINTLLLSLFVSVSFSLCLSRGCLSTGLLFRVFFFPLHSTEMERKRISTMGTDWCVCI